MPRGLYLHLPFCLQKCHYCDFVITLDRTSSMRERFLKALESEIRHAARQYGRLSFETLYLGGGTSSLLIEDELAQIAGWVGESFDFAPGYEFTMECNPGDVDRGKAVFFKEIGINRVSLGVQAFQDHLLRAAGRHHTVADIEATLRFLKDEAVENISFDLIAGLPDQTLNEFQESLKQTLDLGARQLSFYDLDLKENTAWGIQHQKGRFKAADEKAREAFFALAVDRMTQAGYGHYEVSTFAKPGYESRHNLLYWRNQEYLGLGPGAYSFLQGLRYQVAADVPAYFKKADSGNWEASNANRLNPEEQEKESLITGLRLQEGLNLEALPLLKDRLQNPIQQLMDEDLIALSASKIRLTRRGCFLAESIFKYLFASL